MESARPRPHIALMPTDRAKAKAEFVRIIKWILLAAVLMVVAALIYLGSSGDLTLHTIVATILGVFFSVLLGCGLFAAAFFSDKSGLDRDVTDATRQDRES